VAQRRGFDTPLDYVDPLASSNTSGDVLRSCNRRSENHIRSPLPYYEPTAPLKNDDDYDV
jgi:hypothetical protein